MARLKGGRVLIDSGYITNVSVYSTFIDGATCKAIVEKGLSILVTESAQNFKVCLDLIPSTIDDSHIEYHSIVNDDGDTIKIDLTYDPTFVNAGSLNFNIQ